MAINLFASAEGGSPAALTLQTGTANADTLSGGSDSDNISGLAGNDILGGGGGDDTLSGGFGTDTLTGGAGADRLDGGSDSDLFIFLPGDSPASARDVIDGWDISDRLLFAGGGLRADYEELSELTFEKGAAFANNRIAAGIANFVVMRTGEGTFLFVDSNNDDGAADQVVQIVLRSLDDISIANFVTTGVEVAPVLPPPPARPAGGAIANVNGSMDLIHPAELIGGLITDADDNSLQIEGARVSVAVSGTGFTYLNNQLVGGSATYLNYSVNSATENLLLFNARDVSFPAASLGFWVATDDGPGALAMIFAGSDSIRGGGPFTFPGQPPSNSPQVTGADLLRGYGGNDLIAGVGGADTIYGGTGDDQIYAGFRPTETGGGLGASATYLRGDEGNDYILGGLGFDDINGNMGNDTASGGEGEDWVVGGKDNDLLFGDAAYDLVYGNLGNDTCDGGAGNDIVRGGQDNDVVRGGDGDDFLSGDKGDDTMTGGLGADIFHTFGEAGLDRVTDFNRGHGDRVQLDPGTQYSVAQAGLDTVISMVGGGQMVLVGVQLSSLPAGWIFGA